ncbi:heme o synthase [Halomarina halobia]|uniref:Protoheme IX farnesyltransferase n=1 Tax=Halomarina halobia TaxID=3033386 RepID=A0ABD6ABN4_9EURY
MLAAATVGVYLLVVVGATAALADAVAACGTWPLCAGPLTDPQVAVATGHRVAAAAVGALVLAAVALGWSSSTPRVRAALFVALALYPVQVGVGAFVAVADAPAALSGAHLLTAMVIFGSLALALAWQLEVETGDRPPVETAAGETPPDSTPVSARSDAGRREGPLARAAATAYVYFKLMKPRLMWLLCLVASAAMALAAGPDLRLDTVLYTLGGGVLAIGASGTFNHVLERDIDRKMARTADRPLATHRVPVRNALAFGGLLTLTAVVAFLQVNPLTALLGFTAIVFYSVVYTLVLKPNTVQNTVIGGAAGALPALIGWAAVTNAVELAGIALAGVIFLWTPAHFYNLALAYKEDYARGGFPMMPVVRGETATRRHIVYYLAATLLGASVLTALSDLGWLYAGVTVAFGALFLWTVVRLHRERTKSAALRAFHASNAYLGMLLVAVLVDAMVL